MGRENEKKKTGTVWTTILIVLVALVCVTLATRAWFSIADHTRLKGVNVDITTGKNLRFDLEAHDAFEDYQKSLSFDEIAQYVYEHSLVDMREQPLVPVTTADGENFYYENGDPAEVGDYIDFVLHFRSTADMHVHLTSNSAEKASDGTRIESDSTGVPAAMRIAFVEEPPAMVYDSNLGDEQVYNGEGMISFGLLPDGQMLYNENNVLFDISEGEDVPVKVRIWVEGTDPACTNDIKFKDFKIYMRFEGTDEEYNLFD